MQILNQTIPIIIFIFQREFYSNISPILSYDDTSYNEIVF